jgi:class 3 adenylate cyclase
VHRKVVSVLFCDVVGSTALGESVDPEALQGLLARYFERMKAIVESHGGTVEKFIGDAVMAVFGVPAVHEDDALRACRAAAEMRAAFPELGVQGRIGVNTGEVVTGTEERLATGDAVNVAARLQQAAAPDEVLLGKMTFDLVRGAVETEPVEPLRLKGKAEAVPAVKLVLVRDAPERSHASRFVGRERELALIDGTWRRAQVERRCQLLTIVGDAGVGKTRLISEALGPVDARVVHGRCLSYGEGITYWPVVEVVKQLNTLPTDVAGAEAIRSLLGESELDTSAEEIAWAFRKLLEEQSPLVVVFDDLHWGEETFLDLVEGVALLSSEAPILLVCAARPELVDRRPSWPVLLRLEPLPAEEVDALIGDELATGLRERVAAVAGGNPLFVTELLAMLGESEVIDIPPTLRSLLAARLDQLETPERRVLERGSVEGEFFHRGAVHALAPEEKQLTPRLAALVRRELIRPERARLPNEDGFRFRHLLIRDAAYEALPKFERARLHEAFAEWLETSASDLVELDEIVGHHLDQAATYSAELGQADSTLRRRAAVRRASAGRRAAARGDMAAAVHLLRRATVLLPEAERERLELLPTLAAALRETGAFAEADQTLAELRVLAQKGGDRRLEMHAVVEQGLLAIFTVRSADVERIRHDADAATSVLAEASDNHGLAGALHLSACASIISCELGEAEKKLERALFHARQAGDRRLTRASASQMATAIVLGPRRVEDGRRRCDRLLAEAADDRLLAGRVTTAVAYLEALEGRFDEARALGREGSRMLEDVGARVAAAAVRFWTGQVELLAGDARAAEIEFRLGLDRLEEIGETGVSATLIPLLCRSLVAQGRNEEAEPYAALTEDSAAVGDVLTRVAARLARSELALGRGESEIAGRLAEEAVDLTATTDAPVLRGDALLVLAGATDNEAAAAEAHALFTKKGSVAGVRAAERLLVTIRGVAQP